MSNRRIVEKYIEEINLEDFQDKTLSELLEAIEKLVREVGDPASVKLNVTSYDDYYSDIEFYDVRLETDAEFNARVKSEAAYKKEEKEGQKRWLKEAEANERKEYERLKKKFGDA